MSESLAQYHEPGITFPIDKLLKIRHGIYINVVYPRCGDGTCRSRSLWILFPNYLFAFKDVWLDLT